MNDIRDYAIITDAFGRLALGVGTDGILHAAHAIITDAFGRLARDSTGVLLRREVDAIITDAFGRLALYKAWEQAARWNMR